MTHPLQVPCPHRLTVILKHAMLNLDRRLFIFFSQRQVRRWTQWENFGTHSSDAVRWASDEESMELLAARVSHVFFVNMGSLQPV